MPSFMVYLVSRLRHAFASLLISLSLNFFAIFCNIIIFSDGVNKKLDRLAAIGENISVANL
jgi:hypothetical protein